MLELLEEVWRANPDLRLGQLINAATINASTGDAFYVEDDVLAHGLRQLKDHHG